MLCNPAIICLNQINWTHAAYLKQDWHTVSSAFGGYTCPNLTQIQNCFKFNVTFFTSKYNSIDKWKKNTTWVTWLLLDFLKYLVAVSFLLLRGQRYIKNFQTQRKNIKQFFECIYYNQMNVNLFWSFLEGQLNALESHAHS